jgi:UDP-N-acetylglucosamine acyltransferase
MEIHATAVVSPRAELAPDVRVGPYAVVEDDVVIGSGCEIGAHAVVKRFTTLGERNRVYEHATLGGEPQDVKFRGEPSRLVVGDDNTLANGAALAGHIRVEDHVFFSSNVGAHQFVRFGRYAMVGGKSKVVQDVLPYFTTDGNPPRVRGLNTIGLRRGGFTPESRAALKRAYQILFRARLPLAHALSALEESGDEHVRHLARFIRDTRRGFTREDRETNVSTERELLFKVSR